MPLTENGRAALRAAGRKGGTTTAGAGLRAVIDRNPHHQSEAGKIGGRKTAAIMRARWCPAERSRFRYAAKVRYIYGLEPIDVARLWDRQHGSCPVCLKLLDPTNFVIDHDHVTKIVRGLLHDRCNHFILPVVEHMGDRIAMYAAITPVDLYLAAHAAKE